MTNQNSNQHKGTPQLRPVVESAVMGRIVRALDADGNPRLRDGETVWVAAENATPAEIAFGGQMTKYWDEMGRKELQAELARIKHEIRLAEENRDVENWDDLMRAKTELERLLEVV